MVIITQGSWIIEMDFLRLGKAVLLLTQRTKGLIANTSFPMVIPNKPFQIKITMVKNHYGP